MSSHPIVTVVDGTGGGFDSATKPVTSSSSGSSGSVLPNPLNDYSSYNYIVTLSPLSNDDINYPDSYRSSTPNQVVLKSGGSGSMKIPSEQESQMGIKADLYIEDLEILTLAGPNPNTKMSNAVTVDFKVIEPYSMGMFLETLKEAAKTKGFPNYINAPFLLTIEFIGWDDAGKLKKIPKTKRMFPIKLIDAKFTVDITGSKYEVKGIAWNDIGFADEVQTTKTNVDLEGETINELLQTSNSGKSLATILNNREIELKEKGEKPAANEYIILFPNLDSDNSGGGSEEKSVIQAFRQSDDDKAVSGDPDAEVKKIKGYKLQSGTIGDTLRESAASDVNEIGKSKIAKSYIVNGLRYFGKSAFVEDENKKGTFRRDQIVANEYGARLNFPVGMRIQEIIEEVILLSEYGRKFLEKEEDSAGMRPWFKIETNVYLSDQDSAMTKTGDKAKIYVYKVIPYRVNTDAYKQVTAKTPGLGSLRDSAVKEYNYLYTGKNDSVIDFNIDINFAYISAVQNDMASLLMSSVVATSENMVEEQGEEDPEQTLTDGGEIPDEGSPTTVDTARPSTGARGGGAPNQRESQMARNVSDMITNGIDLIQLDLSIWGDPYFISDTGVGNYTAKPTGNINLTDDGTMDYQHSEVDIIVNFRTPTDIGKDGMMSFPSDRDSSSYKFSGLYRVIQVLNKFSEGEFTQDLLLLRRHNQDTGGSDDAKIIKEKG